MLRHKELLVLIALAFAAGPGAEAEEFSTKKWPMWLVSSTDGLRSPPPPADPAEELRQLKDLTSRRTAPDMDRITWWDVGGPVYRWNQIASNELLDHGVNTLMATRHLALVHAAMQDATVVAWDSNGVLLGQNSPPSMWQGSLSIALLSKRGRRVGQHKAGIEDDVVAAARRVHHGRR